jgi:hypothetical protein
LISGCCAFLNGQDLAMFSSIRYQVYCWVQQLGFLAVRR